MTECRDCSENLEHCHGVLVVFDDGTAECTECGGSSFDIHEWRVPAIATAA
jgi:uncharacterized Zn finger protein